MFKVGDKVKLRKYNSKKEYNKQYKTMNCGWGYKTQENFYNNNFNKYSIIVKIDKNSYISTVDSNLGFNGFWPYQIEKVNDFRNKIKFVKELIK